MRQVAMVKELNSLLEEEVTIEVNSLIVTGFAYSPYYQLIVGNKYPVSFSVTVLDDFSIKELTEPIKKLEHIGGFCYKISGQLLEGTILDAGIFIEDDLLAEFDGYIGSYVELIVDRINIEFLK